MGHWNKSPNGEPEKKAVKQGGVLPIELGKIESGKDILSKAGQASKFDVEQGGLSINPGDKVMFEFEDSPQCWEYATHVIPQDQLQPALTALGIDGWELVQGLPCAVQVQEAQSSILAPPGARPQPQAVGGMMMIFKRPKARGSGGASGAGSMLGAGVN